MPALTVNGYLDNSTLIYQGSIDQKLFCQWLDKKVLPKLRPQYHVLVMDNCAIHHGDKVKDLCESYGIEIQYLPPYSPDYNPIEFTFNTLKAWIRRHFHKQINFETFGHFLRYAVEEALCSDGNSAAGYFLYCGYE